MSTALQEHFVTEFKLSQCSEWEQSWMQQLQAISHTQTFYRRFLDTETISVDIRWNKQSTQPRLEGRKFHLMTGRGNGGSRWATLHSESVSLLKTTFGKNCLVVGLPLITLLVLRLKLLQLCYSTVSSVFACSQVFCNPWHEQTLFSIKNYRLFFGAVWSCPFSTLTLLLPVFPNFNAISCFEQCKQGRRTPVSDLRLQVSTSGTS